MNFLRSCVAIVALAAFLPLPGTAQSVPVSDPRQILTNAGAPVNGTNEIQTLTFGGTPTGGTFKLRFKGFSTASVSWSATNGTLVSNIDTALEALPNIGTGGVTTAVLSMTAGIGTINVTFTGNNAKLNVDAMTVPTNALTGTAPTLAVTTPTPGVNATARGAAKGILLVDTTNANLYQNEGTTGISPTWTQIADLTLLAVPTAAVADIGAVTQDTVTDSTGGTPGTTLAAITSPVAVTNSTGGSTADTILAAITTFTPSVAWDGATVFPSAADATAIAAAITAEKDSLAKLSVIANANAAAVVLLKNDVASLAAQLAKIKTDNTADRAKINDALAKLRTGGIVTP